MATVQIEDSSMVSVLIHDVSKRLGGFLDQSMAVKTYKALFVGATRFLSTVKTTKNPVAFTVSDKEGNFVVAGVVEYTDAPDAEDDITGNWNFYFTYRKEDIPENATVYDVKNQQTHETITAAAWEYASARFEGTEALIDIFIIAFEVLRDYMMEGAVEGDVYELVYPGVFKAQSAVEDGEKVVSLIPDGLIKKMIKDDSALENAKK